MKTKPYTATAMLLHWLMALGLFMVFPLGLYMQDLKLSPVKLQLYSYHKWLGVTLLLLVLLRIMWRISHTPPALSVPGWQKAVSSVVHQFLYLLMLAIPLSGWLMSSAKGVQTVWFGIFPIPDLVHKDIILGKLLENVHEVLNYTLLALVILHIAAALKHRFIDHDDILSRMLPGRHTE